MSQNLNLNGLFLIKKESGMTSHDVVFSLRKIIKDKQVGHIGTLDPMAEGLLVCLVGESVKLSDYLMGSDKKYRLTLKLGIETDTWDISGKVLKTTDRVIESSQIEKEIRQQVGVLNLPIPMYSAKKVDGKKLYEVARKTIKGVSSDDVELLAAMSDNDSFEGPGKEMKFWDLEILDIQFPYVSLEFWCSKGSFVRSWVYSLGKQLGTGATMTKLERLAIGHYDLKNAVTLNELRSSSDLLRLAATETGIDSYFLNSWQALQKRTILELEDLEKDKLKSGLVSYVLSNRIREKKLSGDVFCFFNRQLVGILSVLDVIEVKRIFVNSAV